MSRVVDIQSSRIRNFFAFQRDPLGFLVEVLHDGDVISLRSGRKRPSYIVNSPEFVYEILVAQESSFVKGRSSQVLRRTIGDGLLTTERETHHKQKQLLQPAFYKERIQAYARTVVEEAERAAERLPVGQPVSLSESMMQLTLTIIARTMFAADLEDRKQELAAAVNATIERTARTLFSPVILPLSFPTPGNRVHRGAIRTLESMVYEVISEARSDPDRFHPTLLGMLMDTRDTAGRPLAETEIRDQMMTMLLAGHETTANLLCWIWYLLGEHPEAEARFHEEADRAAADPEGAYDAYRSLSFTQQIIQETLRLYPPAWTILRESDREVTMLGHRFPEISFFMISPYAMHRNGNVFEDPLAFRPERFREGAGPWPRFSYFPFGGGSRSCIGANFALMEAALILSVLGRRFRFRRADAAPVRPEPLVSLRIRGGLTMIAEPR
ncbi:cytochrome P450 [Paenibacillus filicis]|uniref:Cytochrome P450 n=1 Tax=Paenibacillus gyeongsangnamensis TaxID=3388067 RepID=A0ABT4Q508_9BACL|nr:cytochrome P450 [Paenibacillus filicis]MCZ8511958.1 cytochrome P450 [Paenibacillus filicis]